MEIFSMEFFQRGYLPLPFENTATVLPWEDIETKYSGTPIFS